MEAISNVAQSYIVTLFIFFSQRKHTQHLERVSSAVAVYNHQLANRKGKELRSEIDDTGHKSLHFSICENLFGVCVCVYVCIHTHACTHVMNSYTCICVHMWRLEVDVMILKSTIFLYHYLVFLFFETFS